ncbi:nitroreductase [Comamonas humi]
MTETTVFENIVRNRRATRQFLPTPVAPAQIQAVLRDAQHAPSNCNTQPWQVHIVSGAKRDALAAAILAAEARGEYEPDFSFDMAAYSGAHAERAQASGKAHYDLLEIAREDQAGRREELLKNFGFFGAPHVALLFMPSFGDSVRTAGDIGMYGQTFLLSLAARGLAGIPQTSLAMFAPTIRSVLGIADDHKMLFGISFGHRDPQATVNRLDVGRAELSESVVFHQ